MTYLAAFILALFVTLLFVPSYRRNNSSMIPLLILFFVLLMSGIASQLWITPSGPVYLGISWLPLLFIIILFTLLFAAPSPYERRQTRKYNKTEEALSVAVAGSIFIWLLLLLLLAAVFIGILRTPVL
jgi:hypothetical protein